MISYLKGCLEEKNPSFVILDINGIGYHIYISLNTFSKLPENGNIKLYTHLLTKNDTYILYGFYKKEELKMFLCLISVNGIGPVVAILILSSLTTEQIIQIVLKEEIQYLQKIKGIGKKIAQRIIMELKDKISVFSYKKFNISNKKDICKLEAINALEILGFSKKNIEKIVDTLLIYEPNISIEELIKKVLRKVT